MRKSEVAFLLIVMMLIAAAVAADRFLPQAARARSAAEPAGAERFLSATAYCPAPGTSITGEKTQSFFSTTNLGGSPVHLRRSAIGEGRESELKEMDLGSRRRTEIGSTEFGIGDAAGVVESFGAPTVSDDVIVSGSGVATHSCSAGPADRWLFATGSTGRGKDTYLLVANPFEEEARIRVRVMTATEDVIPSILKDLLVPSRSQISIFMAENFAETESFAMDVAATRGRVIISRVQRIATRDGLRGLSLVTGARRPSERWFFAGGEVPAAGEELILLVNPGGREALVKISFQTESEQSVPPELQQVAVPAGRQLAVKVSSFLPPGTRHGTLVASANEIPVVVERQTVVAGGGGADGTLGATRTSRRWLASAGSPVGGGSFLALTNFGRLKAVVNIVLITGEIESRPLETTGITIDPGRRVTVDLTPFLAGRGAAALIEAVSGEVGAESRLGLGEPYRDFADAPADPL